MSSLLEPAFLRELQLLKRKLEVQARSRQAGERLARRRGSSAEFEQHRSYVAGDDVRRVDWLATARSGMPVIKQFRSEEDPIVRILLDRSASMNTGEPNKLLLTKRLAAALGYLTLESGARVQLIAAPGDEGSGVRYFEPRRGRGSLSQLLKQLSGVEPTGATALAEWTRNVVATTKRPGLLAVLSDFLDHGGALRELDLARGQGHEVALIQFVSKEELEPDFEGDVELEDVETNEHVELTLDQSALDAYLSEMFALLENLRAWSRQRGQAYVRVTREQDLGEAMRRFVTRGQD